MSAPAITNWLKVNGPMLTFDIAQRLLLKSVFPTIVRRKAWKDGISDELKNTEWQRPLLSSVGVNGPGTRKAWTPIAFSAGENGGGCVPLVDEVKFLTRDRSYNLSWKAIESPEFCVHDLLNTTKRNQQMAMVVSNLAQQVDAEWTYWYRSEIMRAGHIYVAESGLDHAGEDEDITDLSAEPTSTLTQGVIDHFVHLMILDGLMEESVSKQNGAPIVPLITDMVTSRRIIRSDDAVREDFRASNKADMLLAGLGVAHTYGNAAHLIDKLPARFSFSNGAYSEVEPYEEVTNDDGQKSVEVSAAYKAATIGASHIVIPGSIDFLVPPSLSSVGAAKFNPQKNFGEFDFKNWEGPENPDGLMGHFRGVLRSGTEPVKPQFALTILHKVCPIELGLQGCADE